MNEHTLVYTLNRGWVRVGSLEPGPHKVLVPWRWATVTFDKHELAPAWYTNHTSVSHPLFSRTSFRPWSPEVPKDRKLGCLYRLGRYSSHSRRWLLPTQDMVDLAIRLAKDSGVAIYYRGRYGFEAELPSHFSRPDNVTYDFDVGANLLRFNKRMQFGEPGPAAIKYISSEPVLTKHRFTTGGQ